MCKIVHILVSPLCTFSGCILGVYSSGQPSPVFLASSQLSKSDICIILHGVVRFPNHYFCQVSWGTWLSTARQHYCGRFSLGSSSSEKSCFLVGLEGAKEAYCVNWGKVTCALKAKTKCCRCCWSAVAVWAKCWKQSCVRTGLTPRRPHWWSSVSGEWAVQ